MKEYRNALGDLIYSERKHEEEMAKYEALGAIAAKPAQSGTWMYFIPVLGIAVVGVILAVILKKRKS
jgi:LPXTG-motif cell wall-anchored protein